MANQPLRVGGRLQILLNGNAGLGGRADNTDFLAPVASSDRFLSANAYVNCMFNAGLSTDLTYVFEDGLTRDSNASEREYERHLVTHSRVVRWQREELFFNHASAITQSPA